MLPGFPIPIMGGGLHGSPQVIGVRAFGQSGPISGARSVSVQHPVGWEPGDLIIALAVCSGNEPPSAFLIRTVVGPEGWAPISTQAQARVAVTSGVTTTGVQILMRVAQAGDTTFSFLARACHRLNVTLMAVRGAKLPIDAVSMSRGAGGTVGSADVVAELATLLLVGGFGANMSADPIVSGPVSATQLLSYAQGTGDPGGLRNWMGVEYDVAAGSTGSRVWTENSASNTLAMVAVENGIPGPWLYGQARPELGTWKVPAGVTSVNILCVGAGGRSWQGTFGGQGGGGACAYTNGVAVTPGETLFVTVGESLAYNTHNTDECASYVRRGSTRLVLADYGRPAQPTGSPGFATPGERGLSTNCIGDVKISGGAGENTNNNGGQGATPYGFTPMVAGAPGMGIGFQGQTFMQSTYGGYGGGAAQSEFSAPAGAPGLVIITWGMNRSFGLHGGRFI